MYICTYIHTTLVSKLDYVIFAQVLICAYYIHSHSSFEQKKKREALAAKKHEFTMLRADPELTHLYYLTLCDSLALPRLLYSQSVASAH